VVGAVVGLLAVRAQIVLAGPQQSDAPQTDLCRFGQTARYVADLPEQVEVLLGG
jgi:hypothetical protein